MRLNVRCCCGPDKIFGTLEVSEEASQQGRRLFALEPVESTANFVPKDATPDMIKVECAEVRIVEEYKTDKYGGRVHMLEEAVYSEERPIEFWRTIRGFYEGERSYDATIFTALHKDSMRGRFSGPPRSILGADERDEVNETDEGTVL